jgi:hypothetical protein
MDSVKVALALLALTTLGNMTEIEGFQYIANRYSVPLEYLVYSDSLLNFEFEGKIKFITVT